MSIQFLAAIEHVQQIAAPADRKSSVTARATEAPERLVVGPATVR